ncbi:hypothetical protein EG68_10477 [Paragonimus skrjabini miyazakii]|uniref:Uncharacterized protein n=1 Tax=Paragonimus skrjabini miyazakii TaxID=59628 RepID=A0A8S9Y904_9TREM|nr:hypothetical protein EG68_10477 [Paragonimus skrjabini miyazakii]
MVIADNDYISNYSVAAAQPEFSIRDNYPGLKNYAFTSAYFFPFEFIMQCITETQVLWDKLTQSQCLFRSINTSDNLAPNLVVHGFISIMRRGIEPTTHIHRTTGP